MDIITPVLKKSSRQVYKLLGSSNSTKLAESTIGQILFNALAGTSNTIREYRGQDNLKLLLTPAEAYRLGFFHLGTINPFETQVIKQLLQPGETFIDIGAYIDGWHSLIAAKQVGPTGSVHIFEPVFYDRLKQNVRLNNLTNIKVSKLAVSNNSKSTLFYSEGEISSLVQKHVSNQAKPIKVKTISLDQYIKQHQLHNIRLCKIDVEGAEMKVLQGAKKLLSLPNAPDLMLEVVDDHLKAGGSSRKKLLSYLKSIGYHPFYFDDQLLKPLNSDTDQLNYNLYFSKTKNPLKLHQTKTTPQLPTSNNLRLSSFTTTKRGQLIIRTFNDLLVKGKTVLDIGCGNGIISQLIAQDRQLKITGCDIDNYLLTDIPFRKMTKPDKLPSTRQKFDLAMFNDVLHHTEYPNQINLIREALESANQVLIFELQPTFRAKLFDFLLNKIHHWNMHIPFTYRTAADWRSIFKQLNANVKVVKVNHPPLYPFDHQAYVLSK